ncbi:MAG: helix-turn-helix domain-containing protein [Pseudomonadota bacterium]
MKITHHRPAPALRRFISAYVVVDDRAGSLPHSPIQTAPMPFGALSVNFCERSRDGAGTRHPETAFLGLQTGVRHWVSGASTLFVMVLLTPAGIPRLFPRLGSETGNALCDLTDLWDRDGTERFRNAAAAMLDATPPDSPLDRWAHSRLADSPSDRPALVDALFLHGRPSAAASALDLSLRTFERQFQRDLGITPTELTNLERLQHSLKARHCSDGSAYGFDTAAVHDGFSDQSHEIRHWRRYLGTSPGRYRNAGLSRAARAFRTGDPDGAVFYL